MGEMFLGIFRDEMSGVFKGFWGVNFSRGTFRGSLLRNFVWRVSRSHARLQVDTFSSYNLSHTGNTLKCTDNSYMQYAVMLTRPQPPRPRPQPPRPQPPRPRPQPPRPRPHT